jgi:hypothetical protein
MSGKRSREEPDPLDDAMDLSDVEDEVFGERFHKSLRLNDDDDEPRKKKNTPRHLFKEPLERVQRESKRPLKRQRSSADEPIIIDLSFFDHGEEEDKRRDFSSDAFDDDDDNSSSSSEEEEEEETNRRVPEHSAVLNSRWSHFMDPEHADPTVMAHLVTRLGVNRDDMLQHRNVRTVVLLAWHIGPRRLREAWRRLPLHWESHLADWYVANRSDEREIREALPETMWRADENQIARFLQQHPNLKPRLLHIYQQTLREEDRAVLLFSSLSEEVQRSAAILMLLGDLSLHAWVDLAVALASHISYDQTTHTICCLHVSFFDTWHWVHYFVARIHSSVLQNSGVTKQHNTRVLETLATVLNNHGRDLFPHMALLQEIVFAPIGTIPADLQQTLAAVLDLHSFALGAGIVAGVREKVHALVDRLGSMGTIAVEDRFYLGLLRGVLGQYFGPGHRVHWETLVFLSLCHPHLLPSTETLMIQYMYRSSSREAPPPLLDTCREWYSSVHLELAMITGSAILMERGRLAVFMERRPAVLPVLFMIHMLALHARHMSRNDWLRIYHVCHDQAARQGVLPKLRGSWRRSATTLFQWLATPRSSEDRQWRAPLLQHVFFNVDSPHGSLLFDGETDTLVPEQTPLDMNRYLNIAMELNEPLVAVIFFLGLYSAYGPRFQVAGPLNVSYLTRADTAMNEPWIEKIRRHLMETQRFDLDNTAYSLYLMLLMFPRFVYEHATAMGIVPQVTAADLPKWQLLTALRVLPDHYQLFLTDDIHYGRKQQELGLANGDWVLDELATAMDRELTITTMSHYAQAHWPLPTISLLHYIRDHTTQFYNGFECRYVIMQRLAGLLKNRIHAGHLVNISPVLQKETEKAMERALKYVFSMRVMIQVPRTELPDDSTVLWTQHWLRTHFTPLVQNPLMAQELKSLVQRLLPKYPLIPESQKFMPMAEKNTFSLLIQYQQVFFDRLCLLAALGFTDAELVDFSKSARTMPLFYRYVQPYTAAVMDRDGDDDFSEQYAEGTVEEAALIDHALETRLALLLAQPIRTTTSSGEKLTHDWQVRTALEIVREMLLHVAPAVLVQSLKALVAYIQYHIQRLDANDAVAETHVYQTKRLNVRFLLGLLTLLDKTPHGITSPPQGDLGDLLASRIFLLVLELSPNDVYTALVGRIKSNEYTAYLIPRQLAHATAGDEWDYFQHLVASTPQDPRIILIALDALSGDGRIDLADAPEVKQEILRQVLPALEHMRYSQRFLEFYFPR